MKDKWYWLSTILVAGVLVLSLLFLKGVRAHESDSHPTLTGWAEEQQVMPEAKSRMGCLDAMAYCSCCTGADIVRSKFRVAPNDADAWEWLNPRTNNWQGVPDDVIHWGEPTPDGRAVGFEWPIGSGNLRCFFPPNGKGG